MNNKEYRYCVLIAFTVGFITAGIIAVTQIAIFLR